MYSLKMATILLLLLSASSSYAILDIYFNDWDSNIAFMNTPHTIFHKLDKSRVTLRGEAFDLHYYDIGKKGPYADYEIIGDTYGTFQFTREGPNGENFFRETIETLLNDKYNISWQAPILQSLVYQTRTKDSAKYSYIITSRQLPPRQLAEATVTMVNGGILKNPLLEENIWAISGTDFPIYLKQRLGIDLETLSGNLGDRKSIVIKEILRRLPNPNNEKIRFHFSDDSKNNIDKVAAALIEESHNPNYILLFHNTAPHRLDQENILSFRLFKGERIPIPFSMFAPEWKHPNIPCHLLLYQIIGLK